MLLDNYSQICIPIENIPWQDSSMFIQRTSGSTGIPFAIPQDKRKRQRRIAELKYYNDTVGFKSHEKLGQCRIWTKWHTKSKKQIFWENIIPINIGKLDDEQMKSLVNIIKKEKLFALRAYASWYDFLVDYLKRGMCSVKDLQSLRVCLSISESLNPYTRQEMLRLTGIPIIETYANEEAGMLGQQRLDSCYFFLNHAGYVFEALKLDKDEPASYGELARIVITDLYNYAFPLIRYDTGDTAIFSPGTEVSNGWPFISELFGRKMDVVYDMKGEPVHPMNFGRILKNFSTIKQWQFIQKGQYVYALRLEVIDNSETDIIIDEVRQILGEESTVSLEVVDEIPVLRSGKRKPVVCEWVK